jgi:two-component system KDP operon response regulator KdpE
MSKKILIVDDDPEMRLGLHVRLEANQYDIALAVDGLSAIAQAHKHCPDLILLDIGLPAGDGFSVMLGLRAIESLAGIPVIVISGRERRANKDRSLWAGAKAYLQKPVENSELLSTIRRVLAENGKDGSLACDASRREPSVDHIVS